MSWAPRLISLSSSGNRYESVSRESSVHSMMSMNCLLMKSSMAMSFASGRIAAALFLRHRFLRRRLAPVDFALQLRQRQRAGDDGAVGEDERRRRVHAQALA